MLRRFLISFLALLILAACSKSSPAEEASLYGVWVNQVAPGDTLRFLRIDGKNILRYNASFNPSATAYSEYQYALNDSSLSLGPLAGDGPVRLISSFRWTVRGQEFEVLGYQLYLIMSSSTTVFRYKRV